MDPLPADLARWWQLADGIGDNISLLPVHQCPHSTTLALADHAAWLNLSAELEADAPGQYESDPAGPAGTPFRDRWLPQWLPIANSMGSPSTLADLRPGPARGCVAEIGVNLRFTEPLWDSTAAMLADIAQACRDDTPVRDYYIWIDERDVQWESAVERWGRTGSEKIDPDSLRHAYADLVTELRTGGFAAAEEPRWSAAAIAAHVRRNTASVLAANEQIASADPEWYRRIRDEKRTQSEARSERRTYSGELVNPYIRYDNTDSMDTAVLSRDAVRGLDRLADDIDELYPRLADSVERLHGHIPFAYARILDRGAVVADEIVAWWGAHRTV